jgi:hypothetical protein
MNTKKILLIVIPIVVLLAALSVWLYFRYGREDGLQAAAEATEKARGVILIPVEYKDGRWSAGEEGVQILPCEPPTYYLGGEATEPLIQLLNAENQVVYERNLEMDPRIIVQEGPSDAPNVLEEISFVLRLPLLEDAQSMEFYVEPPGIYTAAEDDAPPAPDLRVEFGTQVATYEARGALEQDAPCQEPEYKPDQLNP